VRHVFNFAYVLDLKVLQRVFNPDIHVGRVGKTVLKDWQFSGVYSARSGTPINITSAADQAMTKEPGQRAALVPGVSPYLPSGRPRKEKVAQYFNIKAFTLPALGTLSTLPRDYLYGPGYISNNMALGRNFKLRTGKTLMFRTDAFNVFNTPNLANPNGTYSLSSGSVFAEILSTVGTNGAVNTNGRRLQLSLSLKY
jgi:hypothetical protein